MNDTLRILSSLAYEMQKRRKDPQWTQLKNEGDRLQREFAEKHRRNRQLLARVDDMLSAQCLLAEYQAEFQFFLGLQIGLELNSLDLLRDTMDSEIRIRPEL